MLPNEWQYTMTTAEDVKSIAGGLGHFIALGRHAEVGPVESRQMSVQKTNWKHDMVTKYSPVRDAIHPSQSQKVLTKTPVSHSRLL